MGTLGCVNDMMQRDKENRELRKLGRERLKEIRNKLINTGTATRLPDISAEKLEEIKKKTQEKEEADSKHLFRVKLLIAAGILLIFLLTVLLSCHPAHLASHRENGWYHVLHGQPDSISQEPIVTVKDFTALRLDSDQFGRYVISGQISQHKLAKWADETEKAIGRQIAFLFNDSVITSPQVNARIESGAFLISSPFDDQLPAIYEQLKKENIGSTEALFKGWEEDSTFVTLTQEQKDVTLPQTTD